MRYRISWLVLLAVLVPGRLHAQKTDVLTLSNGDQFTGEIKSLDYGLLRFSVQAIGTVSVRWPNVVTVQTDKRLVTVLEDGRVLFGSMAPGTADTIVIQTDSGNIVVPTQSVVEPGAAEIEFLGCPGWQGRNRPRLYPAEFQDRSEPGRESEVREKIQSHAV